MLEAEAGKAAGGAKAAILAKAAPVVRRCKVAGVAEAEEGDSGGRHCMVIDQDSLAVEVGAGEDCLVESWLNASFLIRVVILGNWLARLNRFRDYS